MATHDIALNRGTKPVWPDLCVGCARPGPGRSARLEVIGALSNLGWLEETVDLLASGRPDEGTLVKAAVVVPACPGCGRALERRHRWKKVMLYVTGFGAAALFVLTWILSARLGIAEGARPALGLAVCLAAIAAPVFYELRRPPAFTLTLTPNAIVYEFALPECASRFAAANGIALEPMGVARAGPGRPASAAGRTGER